MCKLTYESVAKDPEIMKYVKYKAYAWGKKLSKDLRDDLEQEGFIGLMRAIDLFDESQGVKFLTFATYHIDHKIQRYIQKITKVKLNESQSWDFDENEEDMTPQVDFDTPESIVADRNEKSEILSIINTLSSNQAQIIQGYYEIDSKEYTIADSAKKLGISRMWANTEHHRALEELKSKLKHLK